MVKKDGDIKEVVSLFLDEAGKKYRIVSAYLYGSFAKGTAGKWSDIDIALISPDFSEDLLEDRLRLMRIAASIDDRIEARPFKDEFFNRNDPLANEIYEHGIQLL